MATKQDKKTDYVERCLDEWAEWNRAGSGRGANLYYSSTTTIGRIMDEGLGAAQDSGGRAAEMPEEVQRVENAVRALPDPERKAIKLKYLGIYLTDNVRAKKLGTSRAKFFTVLDRARWFIRGRLG